MKIRYPHGLIMAVSAIWSALFFCYPLTLHAQLPIKALYSTRYKATSGRTYLDTISTGSGLSGKYTYNFGTATVTSNNYQRLDSFSITNATGTSMFIYDTLGVPLIKFRRVNNAWVTGPRKALWFESDGNTPTATLPVALRPAYQDSLESIFAGRVFNVGIDNAFQNTTTTNNNNIERIDVIFTTGLKAFNPDSAGFAVFDRGALGGNDSFMIAAIKSLDINHNPIDYYPAVRVGATSYGAASGTTFNYHVLRKDSIEPNLRLYQVAGNQPREGVFFSFKSLGFNFSSGTSGVRLFGYSLMSTDVNLAAPGTPKRMVYYDSSSIFPTNTEWGGNGGLDMVAVTGVVGTSTAGSLTLPVLVTDFAARTNANQVALSWQQHAGNDLRKLVVERSNNGAVFSTLTDIILQSTMGGTGGTIDEHPLTGQNYYRLRLVDNGGDITYSPVIVATINAGAGTFPTMEIYPVPIRNKQFTIKAAGLSDASYWLEMLDFQGKPAFRLSKTASQLAYLQMLFPGQLPAGGYTIRIVDGGGAILVTKRVLVE